jgi:RND family efflux transporter MFP subunit
MSSQCEGRNASPSRRDRGQSDGCDSRTAEFRLTVWSCFAVVLVLGLSCGEEPAEPEPVARPVKIIEFGGSGSGSNLEYPGEVSPATNAEVAFEVPGKLIEFPVRESQLVERGELLARLDPRDFQANLDAAKASEGAARAEYDRMRAMFRQDVASQQQLDKAQREFGVFTAQVAKAQKAVDDTMLRAPFDGTVARKIANDFDNVRAKQPIVLLQTGGDLEIVVNVPEKDYAGVKPGLTLEERNKRADARVVLSAIPDRSFPAKLKEFATAADRVTRTFSVTFSFAPPSDLNVMPGMTARLILLGGIGASIGASIPVQAAAEGSEGTTYVWVVDPDSKKVHKTPVTLGALTGTSVAVTAGLKKGDLVVTSGVHQLREGMEVRRMAN